MNSNAEPMSKSQQALWTFLFFTLVGPFVAAILAALYTPVAIWANLAPFTAGDHAPFDMSNLPTGGDLGQVIVAALVRSFVWAPIAAAVAAILVVGLLLSTGKVGRVVAGVAGVIGFFFAYLVAPFGAGELLALFAIASGATAVLLVTFLRRINVLPMPV